MISRIQWNDTSVEWNKMKWYAYPWVFFNDASLSWKYHATRIEYVGHKCNKNVLSNGDEIRRIS